jgi:hypothetical protein
MSEEAMDLLSAIISTRARARDDDEDDDDDDGRPAGRPADRPGPGPTAQMASVDASGFGSASPG